jgi:hypothetical protein
MSEPLPDVSDPSDGPRVAYSITAEATVTKGVPQDETTTDTTKDEG